LQSSEVVGLVVLERCLVQLDDDADQFLCSFVIGELIPIEIICSEKRDFFLITVFCSSSACCD